MEMVGLFVAYSHWDECWVLMTYGNPDPIIFLDADDLNNRQQAEQEANVIVPKLLRKYISP